MVEMQMPYVFCWFLLADFNPFLEALLSRSFLALFPRSILDLAQTIARRRRSLRRTILAIGGYSLFAATGAERFEIWTRRSSEEQEHSTGSLYSVPVSLVILLDQKSDPTSSIHLFPDFRKPE